MKLRGTAVSIILSGAVAILSCSEQSPRGGSEDGGKSGNSSGGAAGSLAGKGGSGGTRITGGSGGAGSGGAGSGGAGSGGAGSGGAGSGGAGSGGAGSGGAGMGGAGSGGAGMGGAGAGGAGNAGMGGVAGMAGAGGAAGAIDTHGDPGVFHFEDGSQGWDTAFGPASIVSQSTAKAYKGLAALRVDVTVTAQDLVKSDGGEAKDTRGFSINISPQMAIKMAGSKPPWAGKTVTARLWFSTKPPVGYMVLVTLARDLGWSPSANFASSVSEGQWIDVTLAAPAYTIPSAAAIGQDYYLQLGVFMSGFTAPYTGTIYLDSVEMK